MLTQQELLVSELMSIMLSILNSKDDRLKKVGMAINIIIENAKHTKYLVLFVD